MTDASTTFTNGEDVQIVKGIYQMFRRGVYVKPTGKASSVVIINGKERTRRTNSIKKMPPSTTSRSSATTVTIPREQYDEMVMEIESLGKKFKEMELKLKGFK